MKKNLICCLIVVATLVACAPSSVETKLREENDSLKTVQAQFESEINDYFDYISQINNNLEKIKTMAGYVADYAEGEVSADTESEINNNIQIISDLIRSNNDKIASLTRKLNASSLKINSLERTIAALTQQNVELNDKIVSLTDKLNLQTNIIASQGDSIRRYIADNEELTAQNEQKGKIIEQKQTELDEVYYVFGSTKELKEQGIVPQGVLTNKKVLTENFNNDYFIKTDRNKLTQIPLYSKRAKLLTTHPTESYVLEKQNGLYVLRITDKTKFWSVSKYLVIDID